MCCRAALQMWRQTNQPYLHLRTVAIDDTYSPFLTAATQPDTLSYFVYCLFFSLLQLHLWSTRDPEPDLGAVSTVDCATEVCLQICFETSLCSRVDLNFLAQQKNTPFTLIHPNFSKAPAPWQIITSMWIYWFISENLVPIGYVAYVY